MNHDKEHLLVNILKCAESFYDIYCRSRDMADFHILQGKLEPPSSIKIDSSDLKPSVVAPAPWKL